ncbi:flagellar hook-basal body complex protein FliE [Paenibacillus sp. UNC451MF]|uniref:flagellar hook-basal body complex protein FliE n=1 Tax=Paenibacillus sp. UNC451MF TaxID=1449063 RepID=UPI00048E468E|nr:flagellar hook-basal body complex protein FliE [Paenibacillus sp. UNC451MF]
MIEKLGLQPLQASTPTAPKSTSAAEVSEQFGQFLNDAMNKLKAQQVEVDKLNNQFAKGETSDVHQVMIASEKASLGLELTVQVRNKVIEAYQEIMRTQV